MGAFGRHRFTKHLLLAAGLLLGVVAYVVGSNWDTFAVMYDNLTAMREGGQVAEEMRYPEDLLEYVAAHPEKASLATYAVGARDRGVFFQADVRRPVSSATHLLLLAEYARQVEADQLDSNRRVALDSLAVYALPGGGRGAHEQALARWREEDYVRDDSTVALRRVVDAITQFGDDAAADWFMTLLGRTRVEALPRQWGLSGSDPPMPSSGLYLSWSNHTQTTSVPARLQSYRALSRTAYADRVYRLVDTLRHSPSFRQIERERLDQRGTSLGIRDQRALARATYPSGRAADYADFLARSLQGTLDPPAAARFITSRIETPVESDSMQTSIAAVGTRAGAMPGIISFVGYVRYAKDRPPRVASLFLEGLPIGVFYHLVQTGLDKGFQLRLLSDPAFFRRVRERLSGSAAAAVE